MVSSFNFLELFPYRVSLHYVMQRFPLPFKLHHKQIRNQPVPFVIPNHMRLWPPQEELCLLLWVLWKSKRVLGIEKWNDLTSRNGVLSSYYGENRLTRICHRLNSYVSPKSRYKNLIYTMAYLNIRLLRK